MCDVPAECKEARRRESLYIQDVSLVSGRKIIRLHERNIFMKPKPVLYLLQDEQREELHNDTA